jgi:hypothetical protein
VRTCQGQLSAQPCQDSRRDGEEIVEPRLATYVATAPRLKADVRRGKDNDSHMTETVLMWITVIALVLAIYFGTGGRAWFGTHEKPERLLGKRVQFLNVDWLGQAASIPNGRIESFNSPMYRIILDSPFECEGKPERCVDVGPHSKGWPVSGAVKRPTPVLATFESGKGFWADLKVIG